MFSFRSDKTGFFVTLILSTLAAGTVISTLVLILVGLSQGDWSAHLFSVKWVLGAAWVLSIIVVLIRVKIFGYQLRSRRLQSDSQDGAAADNGATADTTSSEEGKVSP